MADKFLKSYVQAIGLRNAGLLADTQSRFGRLGIVRDTKGWAFLLEMGSINNDVETVKTKGAEALIKALKTLVGLSDAPVAANQLFADVPATHPDFEAVKWAKDKGVMKGYPDGRLGVDEPLKVGRFLTALKNYDQAKQ